MPDNPANLDSLEAAVEGLLAREANPTPERIRQIIGQFRIIDSLSVDDDTAELLAKRFETRHGVTMTIGAVLTKGDHEPWLDQAKSRITPYYWNRYKRLLTEKRFSNQVLAKFDEVTDRIVGLLENPMKEGRWQRRGMVVGHVQSGKTANYTGVLCKAADAGYRLVVVIAGIHNNLRNQTQLRIDEGFVGRDSARLLSNNETKFVGVGRFDRSRRPVTFTNSVKDFSKSMATGLGVPLQNLNEPAVFVIKKNSSTLKNLLEWLSEHSASRGGKTIDTPMLVIDDEADNASINISHGKGEVSKINGQIRSLLRMFDRACYVGYTATPFANIFIDPDTDHAMYEQDLFPEDFIIGLDPPDNYFGPTKLFLESPREFIRHIEDNEDSLPLKHEKDFQVAALPPSLVEAVNTFVVARAIRLVRGHTTQHCSMLINVSRFTDVQRQIRNEVHSRLERIQASVRIYGALPVAEAIQDAEIAALKAAFDKEYGRVCGVDWAALQVKLNDAAASIKAVEVNSRSSGKLNYFDHEKTGLSVIAVGGFSLSRGLTLEGLMVSYFLRNSVMYDTLMQMGRWFGYRPEYEDLCRVWMLDEAEGWYSHVADAVEELREELRMMEAANATPRQFGLKVRSDPIILEVTARNKMGSGKTVTVQIGLANAFIETTMLRRDDALLKRNREAAESLAGRLARNGNPLSKATHLSTGYLVSGVDVSDVLTFLGAFVNDPGSMATEPGPVRKYVERRAEGELKNWDVLFASLVRGDENSRTDHSMGVPIILQYRKTGKKSDARTLRITDNQRVASRGVEKTGLTDDQVEMAQKNYLDSLSGEAKEKTVNFPDKIYRSVRGRPLLIVHLLQMEDIADPVVAWSISFPGSALDEERVEYVVNTTWWKENYGEELDQEETEPEND